MKFNRRTFVKLVPVVVAAVAAGSWYFLRQPLKRYGTEGQITTKESILTRTERICHDILRNSHSWRGFQLSCHQTSVVTAVHVAAEEWDDGLYSQSLGVAWYGVPVNLFADTITTTGKGYDNLAWTSDKMDGKNTIVWGNYPTSGVIAVTIIWYNTRTKTILEFDMVFDTDYAWSTSGEAGKMDLQNIATHELGHGAGLNDLYQTAAYQETMYGYSDFGETSKRDLYTGDKQGITKLYG